MKKNIDCGNRHIYSGIQGFSIFVLIKLDFMVIFKDGAFPNLKYHLFQVTLCMTALIR